MLPVARCSSPACPLARSLLLLMPLMLIVAVPVQAQSSGNGSIYSRFGLGELSDYQSSQSEALGGGGFALRSYNYAVLGNPALLSDQVLTRAVVGAHFEQVVADDGTGPTSRLAGGTLDVVQFSLPLLTRRLGVGIAYQPFSRSDFRVQFDEAIIDEAFGGPGAVPDTVAYQQSFEGRGGLQRLSLGAGYRVGTSGLSLGASVDALFGILEDVRLTTFASPAYRSTTLTDATRLAGITATLGAQAGRNDVLAEGDALSFGLSLTLPTRLSGERVRTEGEELSRDTLATEDGSVTLPWRVRLGVAYQPDARWTLVADGLYAPWSTLDSDFEGGAVPGSFPAAGAGTLRNRWRLSAGTEFLPAGTSINAPYLVRMAYRLGLHAERLYVSPVAGTSVHELGATLGLSLPTALFGTRVDLNLHAGQRGQTGSGLVRDRFYGFSLTFNAGERWFQERVLR